ncbi:MAG: response regulator [Paenibacillaceae bacterium]|nr:response regulator [Paenibacillaceae bacterium]
MNILVVDDEPIIRTGLRTMVDWQRHGLTLSGDAADGREALERIREGGIDIVLTDIRMPVMDGLELIRTARAEYEDIGFLVLSCLDDYSFVREAMKLGASDYMLKPTMETDDLVAILLDMKRDLEQRREERQRLRQWRSEREQSRQSLLAERVRQAIAGEQGNLPQLEAELFGRSRTLHALHLIGTGHSLAAAERTEAYMAAVCALPQPGGYLLLMPLPEGRSAREAYEIKYAAAQQLASQLGLLARDGDWTVAAGPELARIAQLPGAVDSHKRRLRARFYGKATTVVMAAPEEWPAGPLPFDIRGDLLRSAANANFDGMRHHAERLCEAIRASKPDVAALREFMREVAGMLAGFAHGGETETGEIRPQREQAGGSWLDVMDAEGMCARFLNHINDIGGERPPQSSRAAASNPFIRNALRYMQEHYRRNIGTTDIAAHVRLSRSYLSDLYSREAGESLIETLTRIRIDKAKALLRSGEMKVYEVAGEVGFLDPKSFAKTFKRIVGCTPKEYELKRN